MNTGGLGGRFSRMGSRGKPVVYVTITFSESNDVEGANIQIGGSIKSTDLNGEAQFLFPINNSYDYTITKTGYDDYNGTLIVSTNNFTESVTLVPEDQYLEFVTNETGALSGTMTMGAGGASVNYDYS